MLFLIRKWPSLSASGYPSYYYLFPNLVHLRIFHPSLCVLIVGKFLQPSSNSPISTQPDFVQKIKNEHQIKVTFYDGLSLWHLLLATSTSCTFVNTSSWLSMSRVSFLYRHYQSLHIFSMETSLLILLVIGCWWLILSYVTIVAFLTNSSSFLHILLPRNFYT